ncbi:MAG TPA: (2Fe-2S)-binding protein [Roseococcus sp.]|jgi:bacterioferritin-associated ferredoxin|nr:(2Fe-2S)-binding protein [Roseococcus sp.]
MIACLCNGLTEAAVRDAIAAGARRPKEVYCACGKQAQCGSCTGVILSMLRDASERQGSGGRAEPELGVIAHLNTWLSNGLTAIHR